MGGEQAGTRKDPGPGTSAPSSLQVLGPESSGSLLVELSPAHVRPLSVLPVSKQ